MRKESATADSFHFLPGEVGRGLVFGDASLEEILLLAEIDRLTHPRERIASLLVFRDRVVMAATATNHVLRYCQIERRSHIILQLVIETST